MTTTALATAPLAGDDMVLLVMLPTDDQVMIVQTTRAQTIAELEAYLVAEHARVFPHKAPLSRDVRVQKCVPMAQVVNRRKRTHDQAHGKAAAHPQHCFVELSKNVQVGNVFENMEQIYVVHNHHHHAHHAPAPAATPALPAPTPATTEGKKHKKKTKNQALAAVAVTANANAAQPVEKKPESDSASASSPSPGSSPSTDETPAASAAPAPAKRGRKARKASMDASATTAPAKPETSVAEPPAKKAKTSPSTTSDAKKESPANDSTGVSGEAPPKAKRGRKPKAEAQANGETESAPPAAKRSKTTVTTPAAPAEPAASTKPPVKHLSYKETLALAKERIAAEKRAKEAAEKGETTEASTSETAELKKTETKKPEPKKTPTPSATKEERAPKDTPVVAVKAKKTTKSAATNGSENGSKATKEPEAAKPKKVAKTTEASPKANGTKAVKDAIKAASNALKDDEKKPEATPKRSFKDVLAATRARLDIDKKQASQDDDSEVTTDSSDAKPTVKTDVAKKAPKASPPPAPTQDSSTSSDSDFEDPKPKPSALVKPSSKVIAKAAAPSSDDSTDDEGLDYSQSLLADLTKNDETPKKKTATPATQSSPGSAGKPRGRSRKSRVVLPGDYADLEPESSQSTVDLSQDLLSQKNPESNSVLISSLSKNRFSLDNIPVAKLKKTSKNPFASSGDKTEAPAKRRGRPPKKVASAE